MKKVQTSEWVSIGHPDKMAEQVSRWNHRRR